MKSVSIRNMKFKYYVIKYLVGEQECVYFLVNTSETLAIENFINQIEKTKLEIDGIMSINEIEILNPN
jgi:hypothetical protein